MMGGKKVTRCGLGSGGIRYRRMIPRLVEAAPDSVT